MSINKFKNLQAFEVLDELKTYLPPLSGKDLDNLTQLIMSEGIKDKLIVGVLPNGQKVLVDGHNRYEVAKKHGFSFEILEKEFESIEDIKKYMSLLQLGRRNLPPEQLAYHRGVLLAKKVFKITELAEKHNVNEKTIKRDANFAKGIDKIGEVNPQLKRDILSGKTKIPKADVEALGQDKITVAEFSENLENPKPPKPKSEKKDSNSVLRIRTVHLDNWEANQEFKRKILNALGGYKEYPHKLSISIEAFKKRIVSICEKFDYAYYVYEDSILIDDVIKLNIDTSSFEPQKRDILSPYVIMDGNGNSPKPRNKQPREAEAQNFFEPEAEKTPIDDRTGVLFTESYFVVSFNTDRSKNALKNKVLEVFRKITENILKGSEKDLFLEFLQEFLKKVNADYPTAKPLLFQKSNPTKDLTFVKISDDWTKSDFINISIKRLDVLEVKEFFK